MSDIYIFTWSAAEEQLPKPSNQTLSCYFLYSAFLHHRTPLSSYLFLQKEAAKGLSDKRGKRCEVEKQNKISNMMPEALFHLPAELKMFKQRQKQRASPLTGARAGSDAVSQHVVWRGSSVCKYSFIFMSCNRRKVCCSATFYPSERVKTQNSS